MFANIKSEHSWSPSDQTQKNTTPMAHVRNSVDKIISGSYTLFMSQDFQKPFAAPPTIFLASLIISFVIGLFLPWSVLPNILQYVLGPLLVFGGIVLIMRSMKDIEAADTTYDPYAASTALVTSGIYQFSRNPGYLGLAVIQIGLAVVLDNLWIFVAGLIAMIITTFFVIRLEERKLADMFGAAYLDYKTRVRRWI